MPPRKRKLPSVSSSSASSAEEGVSSTPSSSAPKEERKVLKEKRAARYRSSPTGDILDRVVRAQNQRLYLISQEDKSSTSPPSLCKHFAVLGSTGNVYNVIIDKKPCCTCPDFIRGHLCKHVLFVILKVLRVPSDSPLVYQKALLQLELADIFANAPQQVTASVSARACVTQAYRQSVLEEEGKGQVERDEQKASVDDKDNTPPVEMEVMGECAVCFDAMSSLAEVTACPTCRNNLHTDCLRRWLQHSPTCVYCRAPLNKIISGQVMGSSSSGDRFAGSREGYVNYADMQGLSGVRDGSSYHQRRRYW